MKNCCCQEQRYDNVWLRNVLLASWLWTDAVSSKYIVIMVILVMQIVSRWTFIFTFSDLQGHPEKVNNPWNITLIWYGLSRYSALASYKVTLCCSSYIVTLCTCYSITYLFTINFVKWHAGSHKSTAYRCTPP